jgi:hypothetical protein
MIEGGDAFGQYNRIIRTNFPSGAGSQLAVLSLPGDSFWMQMPRASAEVGRLTDLHHLQPFGEHLAAGEHHVSITQ